VFTLSLKTR